MTLASMARFDPGLSRSPDSAGAGGARRFPVGVPFGCEAITCLDDFSEHNGATWIVPGSCVRARSPSVPAPLLEQPTIAAGARPAS